MAQLINQIAFQGEIGANSDLACRYVRPDMETLPCNSFEETFAAVRKGRAKLALIPIDNSVAGRVADIHHLLPDSGLFIVGEHFQRVEHHLLAIKGTTLTDLVHVHSHVHALNQCRNFIQEQGINPVTHLDTAAAARDISERGDKRHGAIATKLAGEIYDLESHRTERQHPDLSLHEALNLTVLEKGDAERMNLGGGKLFVCTAGMMSEHTAAHDLAVRMASDVRQSVFFVGYADPNSPGGRFKASQPGIPFHFSGGVGELTRHCTMKSFDLTAHAQRNELVDFASCVEPRVVVLGHGEPEARAWVAHELQNRLPKVNFYSPMPGATLEC